MFKKSLKIDRNKIKKLCREIATNRLVLVGVVVLFLFCLLVYRLFVLQIVQGEEHLESFNYKVERTIETSGSRGNIYDCNGKLIAYNQLAYSVTLESTDETAELARERGRAEGRDVSENEIRNEVIYRLIQLLEANGDEIQYDLPLEINGKGKLVFTETGSSLRRFKMDIYGIVNLDDLTGEEKEQAEKWLNSSPEEVYEYLRMGTDGPTGTGLMFEIADSYSMEDTLKIMSVRYDQYMNRYSQTTPITVATNISEQSIAGISEQEDSFPGVEIKTDSLRKYNDAKYIAGIVGYTGVISEDELTEYNSAGGEYEANDVVGKTGIEKTMEATLQGTKGKQKVLVDNLGKIIQEVSSTEAKAGNNVYLTIDIDLQKYAYNILERRLAGIVLAHLTTADDGGDSNMIPIKDVYFALIDNNIIDITKLNRKKAEQNEKEVYQIYVRKQDSVMKMLREELSDGNTSREELSEERKEYMDYIYDMLVDSEIVSSSLVDENDDVYKDWEEGSISPKEFLQYAVNSGWVDISALDIASDYYSSDEIYAELIDYIVDTLKNDEAFDKIFIQIHDKERRAERKEGLHASL